MAAVLRGAGKVYEDTLRQERNKAYQDYMAGCMKNILIKRLKAGIIGETDTRKYRSP